MNYKLTHYVTIVLLLSYNINMAMFQCPANALTLPSCPSNQHEQSLQSHNTTHVAYSNTQTRNRKERRSQGDYSKTSTALVEKKPSELLVEKVSNTINQEHCCITNWARRYFVNTILLPLSWPSYTYCDFLSDLMIIDPYTTNLNEQEFTLLVKKNNYLAQLIHYFVDSNVDNEELYPFISGSTVDVFVNSSKTLWHPYLSQLMDTHITNKIKEKYLDKHTHMHYDVVCGEMYPLIHSTTIELDPEWGARITECSFSMDGHYMKCIDVGQRKFIINLKKGTISHDTAIVWSYQKSHAWKILPDYNAAENNLYYVRIYPVGMASDNIFIYRKPTTLSRLCQVALRNSLATENKNQKNELNALLHSQIISYLPSFVRKNIKAFIKEKTK